MSLSLSLRRFVFIAACLIHWPAWAAGGSAVLQTHDPDGNEIVVQLEFADPQHLRLSSQAYPQAYLLMLGENSYNVMQFGNFPLVIDTDDMIAQMGQGQMPPTPAPTDDIRELMALTPTGEKETVAGIAGERYKLRYVDGAKQQREEVVVASRDALLHDLSLSLYQLGTRMAKSAGIQPPAGSERLARELDGKGLGLLRFGDRLRVLKVDRTAPAAARFELPAPPGEGSLPSLPGFELE